VEFSSAPVREPCARFSFDRNFPKQHGEKTDICRQGTGISGCGKIVQGVCNTSETFAHFSLALRMSIGDNPARSEKGSKQASKS
jgi:hypothetical protein